MKTKHLLLSLFALLGSITANADNITFADANVKALCVANWDTNGDGELSEEEAAAVTDLGTVFKENTTITSFNELRYFRGLTNIGYRAFYNCSNLTSVIISYVVRSIEDYAFYGCSGLTSVTFGIGSEVRFIGEYAFSGCSNLTSITIPRNVTVIYKRAFENCSGLTSVTFEDRVTSIGDHAFYACTNLTSIIIPNSVTSIGSRAFRNCTGLTSITIGNGVTSIGNEAFYGCRNLASVVSEIEEPFDFGEAAFERISDDCELTVPKGTRDAYIAAGWTEDFFKGGIVEASPNIVFTDANVKALCVANWDTNEDGELSEEEAAAVTDLGNVFKENTTITSFNELQYLTRLTSIGDFAFYGCTALTSITIPQGVTSIREYAFCGCTGLTSVTIPSSVASIRNCAFSGCSGLTSLSVNSGNTLYDSRDNCNAIIETNSNTLLAGCKNTIIPSSVTSIREFAFYGCTGLTSIAIPEGVTSIGESVFYGCTGLTSVTIPSTVTDIGCSFQGCKGELIVNCDIPDGNYASPTSLFRGSEFTSIKMNGKSIGAFAFYDLSSIQSIELGEDVTSIGYYAFKNCTGLTSVVSEIEEPFAFGSGVFGRISNDCVLTVPSGSRDAYIAAGWTEEIFKGGIVEATTPSPNIIFADANVKALCIANWDTNGDGELSEEEAAAVTDLGTVFKSNTTITSFNELQYFTGLTSIAAYAFQNCTSLSSVAIPNNVTTLCSDAFRGCRSLASITMGSSVTSIGGNVFAETAWYNNQPDGLVYAGKVALKYKGTMPEGTEIVINDGSLGIADWAFSECSGLVSVIIPNSVIRTGALAFNGCFNLTSATIGNGVTIVDSRTFYNCTSLSSVIIGSSVTYVDYSFDGCTGLADVYCYAEEVPRTLNAFVNSNIASATLHVPEGSLEAYSTTSPWSDFGTIVAINDDPNIIFADANVKALCVANWDTNGDGELSEAEAAVVTDLGEVFKENTTITSFNELQYFTGLTSLQDNVFKGCTNLTSFIIPRNVTSIGGDTFRDCKNRTSISVADGNTTYDSRGNCNAIIETATNKLLLGCTNTNIPMGVTSIGIRAFQWCSFTTIDIPNSVTSIEEDAFSWCPNLTSINIPEGVTTIAPLTFYHCSTLTSFTIPNWVTSIGNQAFEGCLNLSSLTIGDNVTMIDNDVFKETAWYDNQPDGLVYAGKVAYRYKGIMPQGTSIVIKEGTLGIATNAFRWDCGGMVSITIPNSVQVIGYYAFFSCSGLTSITLPNSITTIYYGAFSGCTNLTDVYCYAENLPDASSSTFLLSDIDAMTLHVHAASLEAYRTTEPWSDFGTIVAINDDPNVIFADANVKALCVANWDTNGDGELSITEAAAVTDLDNVFRDNTTITSFDELQYFTGLTAIGDFAFGSCTGLTSVTIPNNVTTTGEWTFYNCSSLTSVDLPEGLTEIARSAFRGSGLESIKFPTTLTEVGLEAFWGAPLRSIDFNGSAVTIRGGAFLGTALETLTIPSNVILRGWSTFYGCHSLQTVTIESVDYSTIVDMFCECTSLKTAVLPSTKIMTGAFFGGCTSLESVTFLSVDEYFHPSAQNYARIFKDVPPTQVQFNVPEGTAESLLQGGYMYLSDLSGLPLVRSEFEAEAARIQAMADALTDGDKTALATAISEARTVVNAAEDYATVYAQIAAIKDAAKIYLTTATLPAGFDVTAAFVTNPNFDRFQIGWNVLGGDDHRGWRGKDYNHYENGDVVVDNFLQAWRSSETLNDGQISQTITNLPVGTYSLECDAIATWGGDTSLEVTGVNLFAGAETAALSTENQKPQHFSVEFTQTETGDCTIGIDINNTSANWVVMDNVKLYRMDAVLPSIEVTDISQMDNAIYIEPFSACIGADKNIEVRLKNAETSTGYRFDLVLPEGITIAVDDEGSFNEAVTLSSRNSGATIATHKNSDNQYTIAVMSSTSVTGNDGLVLTVKTHVQDEMPMGIYPVAIKNSKITFSNLTQLSVSDTQTSVTVKDYLKGDVNGDGETDLLDAVIVLYHSVGKPVPVFVEAAGDVNNDNEADLLDAVMILYYSVGKIPSLDGFGTRGLDPQ